jgi:hypothetical protein
LKKKFKGSLFKSSNGKALKNAPKPTHSIQPLSCQTVQEQPVIVVNEQSRQEMHDTEQRVFARVEKILQTNENDISMLSFQLLPDELIFIFNNYKFLRFK